MPHLTTTFVRHNNTIGDPSISATQSAPRQRSSSLRLTLHLTAPSSYKAHQSHLPTFHLLVCCAPGLVPVPLSRLWKPSLYLHRLQHKTWILVLALHKTRLQGQRSRSSPPCLLRPGPLNPLHRFWPNARHRPFLHSPNLQRSYQRHLPCLRRNMLSSRPRPHRLQSDASPSSCCLQLPNLRPLVCSPCGAPDQITPLLICCAKSSTFCNTPLDC